MGEAKINQRLAAANSGPMPTPQEVAAMEATSRAMADHIIRAAHSLGGPSPAFMARMLAFVTAGRVLAKIGADLGERPSAVQEGASRGMREAVVLAQHNAIAEEGRRLALAAAGERR